MDENPPPPAPRQRQPLTVDRPPHWRARETAGRIFWTTTYAACLPALAGAAFFGPAALWVLSLSLASVLATEWVFVSLARRPSLRRHGGRAHNVLMGVLLGLTLPASCPWYVVVLGGVVTVVIGKGLLGGMGHYLWHPVLIGRLVIQVLFVAQVAPAFGPVLDRHHLFWGDIDQVAAVTHYDAWFAETAPAKADGFLLPDPLTPLAELRDGDAPWVQQTLRRSATDPSALGHPAGQVLFRLLWVRTAAIGDLLIGAAPGPLGATCAIAIIVGGLLLIYHGYLRWQLVVAFLAAAAVVAAVAPVRIGLGPEGDFAAPAWRWLPGLQFHGGMPVGPLYVAYHLLAGELLLAVFFFAGEMVSRPITPRGQVLFGVGCGVLTILIRLYLFVPGAAFVAILLMNTLTPLIDRISQPRAFGR